MKKGAGLLLVAVGILTAVWTTVPPAGGSQPQAKHHPGISHRIDDDRSGAEAGESPRRDRV